MLLALLINVILNSTVKLTNFTSNLLMLDFKRGRPVLMLHCTVPPLFGFIADTYPSSVLTTTTFL